MNTVKIRKKPIIVEAVQLLDNEESINNALDFMGIGSGKERDGKISESLNQGFLKLKTPESHNETQNANFTDYILKGYTEELGVHFWPVKESYIRENYELVVDGE